jgi:aminopeptidase N
MFPDNLTRAEVRARSELIGTHAYRVLVDLSGDSVPDPEVTFASTSEVTFTARTAGRTHIDLIADSVSVAVLDGVELDPGTFAGSRLPFDVTAGDHRLQVSAICRYSRTGEGLHRFLDPADGLTYLYTQFEVADARRVFACFEQPDLKARFTFAVLAPRTWTVISNGREDRRLEVDGVVARWDFAETQPLSTYLTAVVAGDYATVPDAVPDVGTGTRIGGGGGVPMSLLCRQSLAGDLDAERIFATTRAGFGVFEERFGHPYAFGKYDQVFVPEYNGGAMENAGCVTLRDDYLFRSRVTSASYEARDNTILHELSHMWFGDLVTMQWWDDLWLKESFAEFASHFSLSETGDDPQHPWAAFCNSRKNWAYRADQLPSTHPIAADMVDLEAVELNFDGITYAKGASVVRQLVAFVGLEPFLTGVRAYFAEHAFGNTRLTDLLGALERASGRDLTGWSAEWLEKAGVNTLRPEFELDADGGYRSFSVQQSAAETAPTLRSHRIAIGLYRLEGGTLRRTSRVETDVRGPSTPIPELVSAGGGDGKTQPDLLLLNDDDLTYAKVRLDQRSLGTLVEHIHQLESPLARAVCWGAAWDMCRDAELPARSYVDLALRGVGVESDLTAVGSVLRQGLKAAADFTPRSETGALVRHWADGLWQLLADAAPGSDHQVALAKAYPPAVTDAAGVARLQGWLVGAELPPGLVVDASLRWLVTTELARLGALDDAAIDREWTRDNTITGAERAAGARAARPSAEAKEAAWRTAVEEEVVPNETHRWLCLHFWQPGQDDVLEPYVERYLRAAEDISANRGVWAGKGISLRRNVLALLFPQPRRIAEFLDRLDGWLASTDLADSVRRVVDERRDDSLRDLRCQTATVGA